MMVTMEEKVTMVPVIPPPYIFDRPVHPGGSSNADAIDGGGGGRGNTQQGSRGKTDHGCAQHGRTSLAGSDVSLRPK
jgi:hypothetical protein